MAKCLLVAGSNSGYQLGVGHDSDVPTLQKALCRAGSDLQDVTDFPPVGYTVADVSSGANHTLALLEPIQDGRAGSEEGATKEIWVAGTGTQGQLGPAHSALGSEPARVFTRLDLEACLASCVDLALLNPSQDSFEPKQIVCGWNCSFVVLAHTKAGASGLPRQDVLLSLGLHRDNTFGELGCVAGMSLGVHKVSFAAALAEAGFDGNVPFAILDIAAGLRHALAALAIDASNRGHRRIVVAGWGSARHGQVGRIPEPPTRLPGTSKRPGPAAAAIVLEPQHIFDWSVQDSYLLRCRLRAGRDHSVVLLQGPCNQPGIGLHCIGSNKQGQLLEASVLSTHAAMLDDIVDIRCNWNSTHVLIGRTKDSPVILSCGSNGRGQFGNATIISQAGHDRLASADLTEILAPKSLLTAGYEIDPNSNPDSNSLKVSLNKLVSGSEHSLLLVERCYSITDTSIGGSYDRPIQQQVWGWGWNEHGNLAQGPHDEADRHRPTLLLDGTRSGTDSQKNGFTPLNIWAGCGTSFLLVETTNTHH